MDPQGLVRSSPPFFFKKHTALAFCSPVFGLNLPFWRISKLKLSLTHKHVMQNAFHLTPVLKKKIEKDWRELNGA